MVFGKLISEIYRIRKKFFSKLLVGFPLLVNKKANNCNEKSLLKKLNKRKTLDDEILETLKDDKMEKWAWTNFTKKLFLSSFDTVEPL